MLKFHRFNKSNTEEDSYNDMVQDERAYNDNKSFSFLQGDVSKGKQKFQFGGVFNEREQHHNLGISSRNSYASIKVTDSSYYDDLNLKFLKNHDIPLKKINTTLYQIKHYDNVYLNMDAINKEAYEIINEHSLKDTLLSKQDLLFRFPIISKEDEEELNLEDRDLLFLLDVIKSPTEKLQEENYLRCSGKTVLQLQKIYATFEELYGTDIYSGEDHDHSFGKRQKTQGFPNKIMYKDDISKRKELVTLNKGIVLSNLRQLLARDEYDSFYAMV